jgi:hypothetical protein
MGLYTLFSDHLGDAELIQWGLSFSTDRDAFSGEQSIRALSAYGGSGLLFHLPEVMNSNSYGALTFAVKSDISNLVITPYLETPAGVVNTHLNVADYVHGGITDEWKVVWIPMRDLTGPMTAAIVNLYLEFNQPGVVWLDEVKVVEHLVWPLPGITENVRQPFGVVWNANSAKTHAGTDYRSGNNDYGEAGITVAAAHDGKIVSTHMDSAGYGCIVVIQSKSNAFTTTYIHLKEDLEVGTCDQADSLVEVRAGHPIGETVWLDTGPHLHFGLRVKPYVDADEEKACAGALLHHEFPEAFVNPEDIDWQ